MQPDGKDQPLSPKQHSGSTNYSSGLSAEEQVIRHIERGGGKLRHHRWRGQAGEIDLVFESGDEILFLEVKSSKTHDAAMALLSGRQLSRLRLAAEEYLGTCPGGSLTPMRLDVALVDAQGRIAILENALMAG